VPQADPGPVLQRGPSDPSVTLEFDLPPEFAARNADGSFVLRAIQVGLFGSGSALVRIIEIARDEIRVSGRTAQVSIPAFPLPAGANRVDIRVRSLSSGNPGAWSEVVGPLTLPAIERELRDRPAARARGVTSQELMRRPALKEALDPLLGSDLSLDEALGSFSRVQDLATAVVLTRTQSLSFAALCHALRGSPASSLTDALARLKPSVNATQAVQAAQAEARRLLARPRGARP
jgi:hypothetical protein